MDRNPTETHRCPLQEEIAVAVIDALGNLAQINQRKKKVDYNKAMELVAFELAEMLRGTPDAARFLSIAALVAEKLNTKVAVT